MINITNRYSDLAYTCLVALEPFFLSFLFHNIIMIAYPNLLGKKGYVVVVVVISL